MTEAIFGLIGVLVGSGISWLQIYWTNKRTDSKNARYLAVRIVCILDKYLKDCAEVVKDDGLSYGQRTPEGYLTPQAIAPGPPIYPEDVDWKSIDYALMYRILSLPAEVETADRMIKFSLEIASPPDFEDWFIERKFYYCQFGLMAHKLSEELTKKHKINPMVYNDWEPASDLQRELNEVVRIRNLRRGKQVQFVKQVLGSKSK